MAYYEREAPKYFNLDKLGKNEESENALFYYSLFNSKAYEEDNAQEPTIEEIEQKIEYHIGIVGSNKKSSDAIIDEILSPGKDTVTCLLLARRLRMKKFEVEPNFPYGGLEIDLFNNKEKIAIEIKRIYSTNNFYRETIETSDKYARKKLKNKVLLLFLLPCKDDSHVKTIERATIGFKSFIKDYKDKDKIIPQLDTFVCGFSEQSSLEELSKRILGRINKG